MTMENREKDNDSVLAFDTLFTTNSIQILKVLLPCLPSGMRQFLAVYIKYLELQYTMHYFKAHPFSFGGRQTESTPDILSVYPQFKNYLTPEGRARFEQFAGTMNSMQTAMQTAQEMKTMMDMMNACQENTEGASPSFDPMDVLQGMLTPEQQAMFDLFQNS